MQWHHGRSVGERVAKQRDPLRFTNSTILGYGHERQQYRGQLVDQSLGWNYKLLRLIYSTSQCNVATGGNSYGYKSGGAHSLRFSNGYADAARICERHANRRNPLRWADAAIFRNRLQQQQHRCELVNQSVREWNYQLLGFVYRAGQYHNASRGHGYGNEPSQFKRFRLGNRDADAPRVGQHFSNQCVTLPGANPAIYGHRNKQQQYSSDVDDQPLQHWDNQFIRLIHRASQYHNSAECHDYRDKPGQHGQVGFGGRDRERAFALNYGHYFPS